MPIRKNRQKNFELKNKPENRFDVGEQKIPDRYADQKNRTENTGKKRFELKNSPKNRFDVGEQKMPEIYADQKKILEQRRADILKLIISKPNITSLLFKDKYLN